MTEPKLLTEAEARAIYIAATSPDDFNERLRERGLIAQNPVDPLLLEAREDELRRLLEAEREREGPQVEFNHRALLAVLALYLCLWIAAIGGVWMMF